MLGDFGEVYVLDWGIAHLVEGSEIVREDIGNIHAGSPGYMAPEQIQKEPITPRTDVFALGVILYEMLAGKRPFDDEDVASIVARSTKDFKNAPSIVDPERIPGAFDTLVVTCLRRNPEMRPATARFLADAIDAYLDQERARAEREADAEIATSQGNEALALAESLFVESRALAEKSEAMLETCAPHDPIEKKQPAWDLEQRGRQLGSEGARAMARASAAFTRALGRVENHSGARAGLARLYFRQFLAAEDAGDDEQMAQYLDLARAFDDGPLALELRNQGELVVECSHEEAELSIARYELHGWLYELGEMSPVKPHAPLLLDVGSYVMLAKLGAKTARFPIKIRRAMRLHLRAELENLATLPDGFVLVPGCPFLSPEGRTLRMKQHELPDFAIGEFPVTFADYVQFLDTLSPEECERRIPRESIRDTFITRASGEWRLTDSCVEGDARARVPPEAELRLPAMGVSWFDALAYVEWLAKRVALTMRLPTSLEWDKAARGVDGRNFPMGPKIDPVFAKLRESRPEASQNEPIGAFPRDVSPFGVRDVGGGVHDWTRTMNDGLEPPSPSDEHDRRTQQRQAIIRGGAWTLMRMESRMGLGAYRVIDRTGWVGFRVLLERGGPSSTLTLAPMRG